MAPNTLPGPEPAEPAPSSTVDGRSRLPRDIALASLLALGLHLLFLGALPERFAANQSADFELFYRPVAESLLDGRGLVDPHGDPAIRYPPGFPAILAVELGIGRALGLSDSASLAAGNAFWTALGGVVFHLLARALAPFAVAWLATLGWLAYPPFLWLGKQPNSETPFFVFAFGALWAAARCLRAARTDEGPQALRTASKWALLVGLMAGLAALIRPVALLLAPVLLAPVALLPLLGHHPERRPAQNRARYRGLVLVGLGLLCQGLVLLPWEAWMYQQSGRILPVSSGGRLSLLDGLTISIKPGREGRPAVGADVVALMHEIQDHRREIRGPLDAAAFLARRAIDDPLPVAKLLLIKGVRSWYATDSLSFERGLLLLQIPLLALAGWGLLRWPRTSNPEPDAPLLILLTTLYFWAMTVLVLSILRYMLPAMALLMLPVASLAMEGCQRLGAAHLGATRLGDGR